MSANGHSPSLRPPGQNGPQDAKPSCLTPEQHSYLVQYLNLTIANELPPETQDNVSAKDVAIAHDAPAAEHLLTPTKDALKPCYMRRVIVDLHADWPDLVLTLQLWLIRNGFTYLIDDQNNDYNVVFVFEGSEEGKKMAKCFYKVWNGRAHTTASDSPTCVMKMVVVKNMVLHGWTWRDAEEVNG